MPTIRPVAHDARLSVIEHLDELRSRLVWIVAAYAVAFGLCFWQNDWILDRLNSPLAVAKAIDCGDPGAGADALEQAGCFGEELEVALRSAAPALVAAGDSLVRVSGADGVSTAARADATRAAADLRSAARALERAAEAAPEATSSSQVRPVTLGVTEPFMTTVTVAGYAALLLTMPLILYHLYGFVIPAFTPREQKVARPVIVAAPVLFLAGAAFAFYLALPRAVEFLQNYNDGQYDILVQARDYYRFTVLMLTGFGLMFQVPLAVLAVVRLQILSPAQLRRTRGYAMLVFAVLAAIVTPTPDPVTMLLAMAPLLVLYEASIQLARLVEPEGPSRWSLALDDERPAEPAGESAVEPERHGAATNVIVQRRGSTLSDGLD